jgi:hypothetical protein
VIETAAAVAFLALVLAAYSLRRAVGLDRALEAERLERLSSSEAARRELRMVSDRLAAAEQRIGRSRRLTAAKRDRALELLAHGASETAIARELEMRESEVALLSRLRNTVGA